MEEQTKKNDKTPEHLLNNTEFNQLLTLSSIYQLAYNYHTQLPKQNVISIISILFGTFSLAGVGIGFFLCGL